MFRLIPAPFAAPNWLKDGALVLKKAGGTALDLIYPPACLACRRAVAEHGGLCPQCWSVMRFIERPYCERLGAPFETDPAAEAGGPDDLFRRARRPAGFRAGAGGGAVRGRAGAPAGPSPEIWRS